MAVAVSAWEEIWALRRERDRWADERRSRSRHWNDWTRLTELRQHFQLHFRFHLDLFADDDFQFHHASKEYSTNRHAFDGGDAAEDVGFIERQGQAEHDFVIELDGGWEFAQQRAVGKYTDQESCAEQEANDTDGNGVSIYDNVFAPDADDGARKVQRLCGLRFRDQRECRRNHRFHALNGDILTSTYRCVYQRTAIVRDRNLVPVSVGGNYPVVHLLDADALFLQVVGNWRRCSRSRRRCRLLATLNGLHVIHQCDPSFPWVFAFAFTYYGGNWIFACQRMPIFRLLSK
ncbi:hypothetical protein [Brevibacillus sp. NRS-1366]|uniref:hypothetical protein n=1 Tax=Brevibacillus sp. NRS-1366 TaxID=3233899 RepID=UPI003D1AF033